MANTNASVGGVTFKVGADSSALPSQLKVAEEQVKASKKRTAEASAAIERRAVDRVKPSMTIGQKAEAANKFASAGGVGALAPVAALGQLGPAALGAGAALAAFGAIASAATTAFDNFQKDINLNASTLTAAGEALTDFKTGVSEAATELAGSFLDALTGGALEERRREQQRGRDLDRQNAEAFKRNQARIAAEAATLKEQKAVFNKITNGVTGFFRSGANQLAAWAKPADPEFDTEPIARAILTRTAEMATYGSEDALNILDARSLAEEQKQSRLLAEIAKKSAPQPIILEF